MPKSSFAEATLLLQIAQWGATAGYGAARSWVGSDEHITDYDAFRAKYPNGSEGARHVALVCSYFETLGALWKHGMINENLIFDWTAVALTWDRVGSWALGTRQRVGQPRLFENFEALANAEVAYDAKLSKQAARGKKRKK